MQKSLVRYYSASRWVTAIAIVFVMNSCQPQPDNQVTKEFAMEVASQYTKARNTANLDLLDNIYAEDVIVHDCSVPEDIRGLDALKSFYEASHAGIPDFKIHFINVLASEHHIVFRGTVEGTHTGNLRGIPPTGNHINFSCVAIDRIEGHMIVEEWVYFNVLEMLDQLGFTSPMPPAVDPGD